MNNNTTPSLSQRLARAAGYSSLAIGIDPRQLHRAQHFGRFWKQAREWQAKGGEISEFQPMLADSDDQAGSTSNEYFHQDLLVAGFIHAAAPQRHIDVGSRIDGLVAHVAVFRAIEVVDIRDLDALWHPNISFLKADLMAGDGIGEAVTDSLSCLHAIEHFGLGRYGDPIDPDGHRKGFGNLWRMLKPGGYLYISFPIGAETRVSFNAHRRFHPEEIFSWLPSVSRANLRRFDMVSSDGKLVQGADPGSDLAQQGICGIYTLHKPA